MILIRNNFLIQKFEAIFYEGQKAQLTNFAAC